MILTEFNLQAVSLYNTFHAYINRFVSVVMINQADR